ncbi:hypothetical protein [Aquitalea sp. ASV15]|uniref:hypothetical protein n=1 Tax=Aquitalea sp. ASV15 TaxID=2795104 RepID=UPI0018EAB3E6|nr:hypothetical protein [Aquitalea sp. ASV15]
MHPIWLPLLALTLFTGCNDDKLKTLEAENAQLKTRLSHYEIHQDSLAYRLAKLAANRDIAANDSNIQRAQQLLDTLHAQYGTKPEDIATMLGNADRMLKEKNKASNVLDIMQAASVYGAVDQRQWMLKQNGLQQFLAAYVGNSIQLDEPSPVITRSLIALQTSIINMGGNKLPF